MEPDALEKKIRFGCGFSFGLVVGFLVLARHIYDSGGWLLALSFVAAIICGWLALKYGDTFWHALCRRSWWWM